jgi:hypothetical protein
MSASQLLCSSLWGVGRAPLVGVDALVAPSITLTGAYRLYHIDSYLESCSPVPHFISSEPTGNPLISCPQTTSGRTIMSPSNFQLVINALGDYAKETGVDLSKDPFVKKLQLVESPDGILQLLQEREKAFKEYRNANRTLISCLTPAVNVLHAFSATLGEAVGLVSRTSHVSFLVCFEHLSTGPLLPGKGYFCWS